MPDRPVLTLAPVTAPTQPAEPKPVPQTQAPASVEKSAEPTPVKKPRRRASAPKPDKSASDPITEPEKAPWRQWGAFHQTVSFKWPSELVAELDDRRYELREPVGLMVVAAITHFLDQDDATIRTLIDQAEQAKPRGGRSRQRTS